MRYAILSDIHANRQALSAAMTDASVMGTDAVICLGDVVGYGPSPAEVLQQVYATVDHILLGNHDAVVSGRLDPANFNSNARRLIEWTATQLDGKARKVLGALPQVLAGEGFRCAHAELAMPQRYGYILEAEDAFPSWEACSEPLLWVGHSHQPGIFVTGQSGRAYALPPQDFEMEVGKRYIVNPGSVGQPRDQDVRASYALYDSETGSICFRRVPFDIEGYRADLKACALPEDSAFFLSVAENLTPRPVREVLDFHPLTDSEARKSGDATVARVEQAESTARRWRGIGVMLAVLLLLSTASALFVYRHSRPETVLINGPGYAQYSALFPVQRDRAVPLPLAPVGRISPDQALRDWQLRLPRADTVTVSALLFEEENSGDSFPGFRIKSSDLDIFELRSLRFAVEAGMRFAVQGRFRPRQWQGGHLEMVLLFTPPSGAEQVLLVKEPPGLDKAEGEWGRLSSRTLGKTNALEEKGFVQYLLRGQFQGSVDVRDCRLLLKAE